MDEFSPSLPAPEYVAPDPPPPSRPPSVFYRIFIGPEGLRAGWRFLIYCAMFAALYIALASLLHFIHRGTLRSVWGLFVGECVFLVSAILPALAMAKIEHRSFGAYGLPKPGAFGRLFWVGTVWGILGLVLLMLMMRASGAFYFGYRVLHGTRILKFAIFYAVLFLIVGLFEEFWIRGYTQFTLAQGIGFWPAAIVMSAAFGAIHLGNPGEAWIGALAAAFIGLFFCLTLKRTGNLWFAVGFHAAWDWGETYLFSVPDSGMNAPGQLMHPTFQGSRWLTGGSVGPEGSVFVFVAIAILWIVFHRTHRESKYGV
jgi:hypothetical protein